MDRDELGAWLRLTLTPGIGPVSARKLLAAFGLPEAIFQQSPAALGEVVNRAQTQAILQPPADWADLVARTWAWWQQPPTEGGERLVAALGESDYPPALLQLADPPLLVYALGHLGPPGARHWNDLPALGLAMVGSRNPTAQGAAHARQFARAFSAQGLCVISGLALGVDGAVHEGALEGAQDRADTASLATVAVVGTGLDRVYPREHRALAHRIARHGLLLSEYPLGTPPLPANFPKRNRLIAALSQGTLVVEAALQSGSLITARQAVEQGKEVFAIPGSIHAPQSRGCHALIKQGAKLVESAQDVLEELQLPPVGHPPTGDAQAAAAPADTAPMPQSPADPLLIALGFDPIGLDALQARTGLPTPTLQARLFELELGGQVARLSGGLYQRCGRA